MGLSLKPGSLRCRSDLDKILDRLAENQLRIRDEVRLMAAFQKVANRITLGLLLAAGGGVALMLAILFGDE